MSSVKKIGIAGIAGRMGRALALEIQSGAWPDMILSGGTVRGASQIPGVQIFTDAQKLFDYSDLVIDFTSPQGTAGHAGIAARTGKPCIIGTTGLSNAQEKAVAQAAKKAPIVYAANMSIGINLLLGLVEQAAVRLDKSWDIEIAEIHHRQKKDAPSGTALALGHVAAAARGGDLEKIAVMDREGVRKAGHIGFAVQRGGDVAGEHTVTFFGAGERLELGHRASDRAIFARGALQAARWLAQGRSPGLYSMRDVLGI